MSNPLYLPVTLKSGTDEENAAYTGLLAEAVFTTDKRRLYIHDNATPGGWLVGGDALTSDTSILVERGATDGVSAANLRTAYAAACALTPGGNALSATNRAKVLIPPGRYDFGSGVSGHGLILDTSYVDLIGLSGSPADTILTSFTTTPGSGTLEQTVDNVRIANVTLHATEAYAAESVCYYPVHDLSNTVLDNIVFAADSGTEMTRQWISYAGKYLRCVSTGEIFGHANCAGYFEDGLGGSGSFGGQDGTCTSTCTLSRCRLGTFTGGVLTRGALFLSGTFYGTMVDCDFKVTDPEGVSPLPLGEGARVFGSTLVGTYAVWSSSAVNAKIAHCRLNMAIHANITNLIDAPYNVIDADLN